MTSPSSTCSACRAKMYRSTSFCSKVICSEKTGDARRVNRPPTMIPTCVKSCVANVDFVIPAPWVTPPSILFPVWTLFSYKPLEYNLPLFLGLSSFYFLSYDRYHVHAMNFSGLSNLTSLAKEKKSKSDLVSFLLPYGRSKIDRKGYRIL